MHSRVSRMVTMKGRKKIVVVTSYDYTMARLCEEGGADVLLVGDSAGTVMLGYDSTIPVSMDHMCLFTQAVSRARNEALVVADMPFLSYQTGPQEALANAGRLILAGADAVKMEGGRNIVDTVRILTEAGIPVMGHIGLQPQEAELRSGYGVRGMTKAGASALVEEASALVDVGVFCIVLEKVAHQAAELITRSVGVPTIGIGSGLDCDGQVLVLHDMLGLSSKTLPFVKRYAYMGEDIRLAVAAYKKDVEEKIFPGKEHMFEMREK